MANRTRARWKPVNLVDRTLHVIDGNAVAGSGTVIMVGQVIQYDDTEFAAPFGAGPGTVVYTPGDPATEAKLDIIAELPFQWDAWGLSRQGTASAQADFMETQLLAWASNVKATLALVSGAIRNASRRNAKNIP